MPSDTSLSRDPDSQKMYINYFHITQTHVPLEEVL